MMAVYVVCSLFVIPVGLAIVYRSLFLRSRRCFHCGSQNTLERIPRTPTERVLGRIVPNRRYRCGQCGWIGLIRERAAKQGSEFGTGSDADMKTFTSETPIPAPDIKPHASSADPA